MNEIRLIPVLSVTDRQLVKTVRFKKPRYIGDPLNAIKIFNDKEVDELVIVDIERNKKGIEPNYALIREMAGESFMPLAYGGGIINFDQAQRVFQCGIEKVILNSACMENLKVLGKIAATYGSQSVVASLDYRKHTWKGKIPAFFSGTKTLKYGLGNWAQILEAAGVGEIILQDIERDGSFSGYDLESIKEVSTSVGVPVVALGGARGAEDFRNAIEAGASAVAAGSHFIFKNNNHESILINYQKAIT